MNNWLTGETSINHLTKITSTFKKKRVADAEVFFNTKGVGYTPFISHPKNYETFSFSKMEPLLLQHKIHDPISLLKLKEELYYSIPSVGNCKHLQGASHLYPKSKDDLNLIETEFSTALKEIENILPWMAKQFTISISEICPIVKNQTLRTESGLSDFRLIGCIFMSIRPTPDALLKLMVSLAHELGHHILFFYQSGQDLFTDDHNDGIIYSSIRKTERSIYGSFQGCVAFAFMGLVTKAIRDQNIEKFDLDQCNTLTGDFCAGLSEGLAVFKPNMMSPLGKRLFQDLIEIKDYLKK